MVAGFKLRPVLGLHSARIGTPKTRVMGRGQDMAGGSSVLHALAAALRQRLVAPGLPQLLVEPSFRIIQSAHDRSEHKTAAMALSIGPALERDK